MSAPLDRRACFVLFLSVFGLFNFTEATTVSTGLTEAAAATSKSEIEQSTQPESSRTLRYDTIEIPRGDKATTLTTDGHTFAFSANPSRSDSALLTVTYSNGDVLISYSSFMVIEVPSTVNNAPFSLPTFSPPTVSGGKTTATGSADTSNDPLGNISSTGSGGIAKSTESAGKTTKPTTPKSTGSGSSGPIPTGSETSKGNGQPQSSLPAGTRGNSTASNLQTGSVTTSNSLDNQPLVSTITQVESGTTKLVPVIIGGDFTTPYTIPTTAPPITIDATGTAASSSASAMSSKIIIDIIPLIKAWTDNPEKEEADTAIKAIKGVIPDISSFAKTLGKDPVPDTPCVKLKKRRGITNRGIPNPFSIAAKVAGDVIHSVTCAENTLSKVSNSLTSGLKSGVKDVIDDIDALKSFTDNLVNDEEGKYNNDDGNSSDSQSKSSKSEASQSDSKKTTSTKSSAGSTASSTSSAPSSTPSSSSSSSSSSTSTTTSLSPILATGEADFMLSVEAGDTAAPFYSAMVSFVSSQQAALESLLATSMVTVTKSKSASSASTKSGRPNTSSGSNSKITITSKPHNTIATKTTSAISTFTNSCYPFADPDAGPSPPLCQCDGLDGFFLAMTRTDQNLSGGGCIFTAPPTPSPTSHPPFTETRSDGLILSCASSTYYNYAVDENAMCAGSSKVISTITSIYSKYTASVAAAQSASAKSAAAAAASATAAAPPPYHTGTCNLHIYEASESYNQPLYVQLNLTDGANDLIASQIFQLKWGDSASVAAGTSHLPYDVTVDFAQKLPSKRSDKRLVVPPPPPVIRWEDWLLTIDAGNTEWNDSQTDKSKLPYCQVGAWDNGNFWVAIGLESGTPVSPL